MLMTASAFNQLLNDWDVSSLTNMDPKSAKSLCMANGVFTLSDVFIGLQHDLMGLTSS